VVPYPGAEDAVDDAGGVEKVLVNTGVYVFAHVCVHISVYVRAFACVCGLLCEHVHARMYVGGCLPLVCMCVYSLLERRKE